MIRFETVLNTAGDGYWSTVSAPVRVTKLGLGYVNDEQDFGELCVYFDTDTWDIHKDGLIYTDSVFIRQLRDQLNDCGFDATDIGYSEQGMQGRSYVSLDVGPKFISSWFSVVDRETV
jgi:hypothetical protein